MRKPTVVLLLALLAPLFAPPLSVRAETTTLFEQSVDGMMDQWRAEAVNGQLGAVISKLEDFVRAHPDYKGPARFLGDLYFRKQDLTAAERTYKILLARFPNDKETWNRLGGLYAAEDRVNEAILRRSIRASRIQMSIRISWRFISAAVISQNSNARSRPRRNAIRPTCRNCAPTAWCCVPSASTIKRSSMFKEALSLSAPGQKCPALNDLAIAYQDVRRVNDAIPLLQACLSMSPNDYSALVNLGESYIELNRFGDARPLLDRAVKVADRSSRSVRRHRLHRGWYAALEIRRRQLSKSDHRRSGLARCVFRSRLRLLSAEALFACRGGLHQGPFRLTA